MSENISEDILNELRHAKFELATMSGKALRTRSLKIWEQVKVLRDHVDELEVMYKLTT